MLRTFGTITRAAIAKPQLRFIWDEWNVVNTYEPVDATQASRLATLSRRANCGFTIAIGEWIILRFDGMDADPEPLQFIEAAWAANIDLRYTEEIDIVDDEWRGPVRGPISMALTFVLDALFAEEAGPNASLNAAWAATFARHVLPARAVFDAWFDTCLARLEPLFPTLPEEDLDWFDDSLNWGNLVPRELFDTDGPFDPAMTRSRIAHFLAGLDFNANPFLRSPAEMRAEGFPTTPYQLL